MSGIYNWSNEDNIQEHYGRYSVGSNQSLFDGFVSGARDGSIKIWDRQANVDGPFVHTEEL